MKMKVGFFDTVFIVQICLFLCFNPDETDYYYVLNVKRSASQAAINQAYKALSRKLHPDKNKCDPLANEKTILLNTASEFLRDKRKRSEYNRRYPKAGLKYTTWPYDWELQDCSGKTMDAGFKNYIRNNAVIGVQWVLGIAGNVRFIMRGIKLSSFEYGTILAVTASFVSTSPVILFILLWIFVVDRLHLILMVWMSEKFIKNIRMGKRKGISASVKRQRDKMRKREKRQQLLLPPADVSADQSVVPCGAADGAFLAPPGNFPGQGSIGLPPIEEKPLARMQASLREKMHSNALSIASSQGSRLCAQNGGMAPSPDSPPWVCISPRVPEPDTVHVSGSAGQAQLDMSSSKGDESSRRLIDANHSKRTISKRNTKRNLYDENENIDSVYERNISECRIERQCSSELDDVDNACSTSDGPISMCQVTVQGSFHQGDLMFGENAGTQCVANSLVALAYHKLKNSKHWQTSDMDNILVSGDELYTYLQRSSYISSRYLLVDELPQFFECFNTMFKFKANESLCSLINLSNIEPNYDEFHAYLLLDALRIALSESDGCFVCFRGNTFLIGKTSGKFFTFDSHSRSYEGNMSLNGCSTRILYNSIEDVYNHVLSLAISMGYSEMVDCEITGVNCSICKIESTSDILLHEKEIDVGEHEEQDDVYCSSKHRLVIDDNDLEVVSVESHKMSFLPLSGDEKKENCRTLGIPFSSFEGVSNKNAFSKDVEAPDNCARIVGDGNCFFRAISFCLTGVEDHHYAVRSAICQHLLNNSNLFKTFLRSDENSVENHIAMRNMTQEGVWVTEVEILALSHLLNTAIHTYTENHWITYSASMVDPTRNLLSSGAIYLYHENENHYDVVLTASGKETVNSKWAQSNIKESKKRVGNTERMREVRNAMSSTETVIDRNKRIVKRTKIMTEQIGMKSKGLCRVEKKSRAAKLKYWADRGYRLKVLAQRKERYRINETYNAKTKERSVQMYVLDTTHNMRVKKASREKYATDKVHKADVKKRSIEKYKKDEVHRADAKKRSTQKYKKDEVHRAEAKKRSTEKYKKDEVHRADAKKRSTEKYKKDEVHRADVKLRSTKRYKTDDVHRADVKRRSIEKYEKDEEHRDTVKTANKVKYHFSVDAKKRKKENVLKQRRAMKVKLEDEDEVVKLFKDNVRDGPEYTCCCCHRLLFKNQVQGCALDMYEKREKAIEIAKLCISHRYVHQCTMSCSNNCQKSSLWICFTCHRKILSGKIPAEAAVNKMSVDEIPHQLSNLNSLEQHLIALHIPFMKVMALPKGGQRNVHGPVVCVPSDMRKATSLPHNECENMLLRVKLKRKLSYKGYYEYQYVNPDHILTAIDYLKKNNRWYQDVVINSTWQHNYEQNDLILNDCNECVDEELTSEKTTEHEEVVSDTCLQPVDIAQEVLDHYFDDVYNIAPGEGKNPVRMLQEEGNEAKTFPHLFPTGNFSWNENREEKITLARYFNNRLMNTDNRFAKDTNYIFFSQYLSEMNQVIEKTQISMRKSISKLDGGKLVTSDMLQNPEELSKLLKNNDALRFMQPIRGTPAYWSATQKDLFAMLRQLGIPTWFCSFSAAEFRWNEIVGSILHHENDARDPSNLDWAEKSDILRNNPVTVARMFENRFHIFQRDVILSPSNPIGNVIDFFIRVEFQQRGSPHMHCLYWVENAPKLNIDSDETVCDFIDRYITCALPSEDDNPELRQVVLAVQQHSKNHSKSCRKKGTECRFNFPRPPSEKTFITRQCEEDAESSHEEGVLNKSLAKDILLSIWNEVLDDVNACKTTEEIFSNIHLTQDMYETAHNTLSTKTSTVLRRNPDEMWTNQYNPCLLRCWDANMDIQYVLDPFSCIVYIISYISKAEREMGMLLKQTQVEAMEGNLNARETMKKIGSSYLNHREVSAQEAVYRVCNLKMKESSRKVIFVPVGENPTRLSKPLADMRKKDSESNDNGCEDDDDEDIWMTNIVERYENRPDLQSFHEICLAEFCSLYRVLAKSQIPTGENESVHELRNGKGYIQKRTRGKPAVIRYPRFSSENAPEKYYQSILQLFLPYVTQDQLKPPGFELYQTFFESGFVRLKSNNDLLSVKTLVESNRCKFSTNEDAIDNAQEVLELYGEPEDAWAKLCPETEINRKECINEKQKTEKLENKKPEVTHEIENNNSSDLLYHITENSNSRQEMLPLLRNLNEKQKEVFYIVRNWCLKKATGEKTEPLHIFVTGGAGTGKSHLIKAIHYEASRLFEKVLPSPVDISVLLTAFTGTAAFNIHGNTLHYVFSLPIALRIPYEPLNEQNLSAIRAKLENLQILVIDEISMVYKRLLYYIQKRLVQIKKCKEPFGGVSVLAVGDFYQLPPVKQRKAERLYNENQEYPVDYWLDFFRIIELDEIMRQREDANFASILNSLRIRTIEEPLSEAAKGMLTECIRDGPQDVLHVYPTNEEANEHNIQMLREKCADLIEVNAEDYQKERTTGKLTSRDKPFISTRTDGLSSSLLISVNARVMLTRNINVGDGLVNGAMGYISLIEFGKGQQRNRVEGIGILFDSKDTGKQQGKLTPQGNLVLIQRVQEDVKEKNTKNVVRHQFPLKLAWACTAHKVQGMTTDSVVVNLDRTFAPGQAYVAISRVTSQNGLFIETSDETLLQKKIYADQHVKSALNKMKKLVPDQSHSNFISDSDDHKTIILLNVQSLRCHFEDLKYDRRILNANFVCLTETWLKGSESTKEFEIQDFEFYHITREESYDENVNSLAKLRKAKGGGVGVYKKKDEKTLIHVLPQKNIEGIAVELCEENTVLVIIYRPSQLHLTLFLEGLQKVIDYFKAQYLKCIIMGDFNEDAKFKGPVQELVESKGFQQKVNFSTTEGSTILDHVYIPERVRADVHCMPVYFSYHEAIKITLGTK